MIMQSSDEVKSYLPFGSAATEEARQKRLAYLDGLGLKLATYGQSKIPSPDIKSNIESFIGTMSIPVGLVGPLLYNEGESSEKVFAPAATTEGALVASMNRGAKVISECGGFRAHVVKQVMSRAPIFCFENLSQSIEFEKWLLSRQGNLAVHIKHFSKHAELIEIKTRVLGRHVEAKFCYRTGDASGQNMTTICTWQSCKWILKQFKQEKDIEIQDFVLEGNGASDKKVSYDTLINGRGTEVIGECFISEESLKRRLKVTTKEIMKWYNIARPVISQNGMMGDNINVANAIAAIFTATGQDIACIGESAIGFLNFEEADGGIYMSLRLPKLVIGTVGGGTSLPSQKENLEIMKCAGVDKVERFAKLICGFAMGLELSTICAMVSGQFAMAHERLGRNKPVKFLENDKNLTTFMQENLTVNSKIDYLVYKDHLNDSNGIITELTASNSDKFIGMSIWNIHNPAGAELALLKSKPTAAETLNCMYILTGMIDPALAKEFEKYKFESDFANCHLKELEIYKALKEMKSNSIPLIYNTYQDQSREIYLILMEFLNKQDLKIFNSEMNSHLWSTADIKLTLKEHFKSIAMLKNIETNELFKPSSRKSFSFYKKSLEVIQEEYGSRYQDLYLIYEKAFKVISNTKSYSFECIIHNDFNPRNIAITKQARIITYDWELARKDSPTRDFIELISFLVDNEEVLASWDDLNLSAQKYSTEFLGHCYTSDEWELDMKLAFSWFLVDRVSLYLVGNRLTEYEFVPKLIQNILTLAPKLGL
jgi:hydroxymethylglutaryl-CoA reductase (NADPH)